MPEADLSESTIRNFAKGRRVKSPNNLAPIINALESAGIEFISENGGGAGVRLRSEHPESKGDLSPAVK